MIQRIITILICCAFIGCAANKNSVSPQQLIELHALIESKNINIVSTRALPMMSNAMQQVLNSQILGPGNSGGSIDIITNVNYVKITDDTISVRLPFFGEQQAGVSTNTNDNSISFDGKPTKFISTYNKKKKSYKIQLQFSSNSDRHTMYITIFSNLRTSINVLSTHRSSIGYRGAVIKSN
jgi:hypothetical protein